MSYEIEYVKKAYRAKSSHSEDDVFFTYVIISSNNVDPRTPHPMFFAIGRRYEIIQQACKFGAECESGMWKPQNRWITPESYIRRWRQVLKEARPLEDLTAGNFHLMLTMKRDELKIYLETEPFVDNPHKWRWNQIRELLSGLCLTDEVWFDEFHTSTKIRIKTYADIERAVKLQSFLKEVDLLCWDIQIQL